MLEARQTPAFHAMAPRATRAWLARAEEQRRADKGKTWDLIVRKDVKLPFR